MRPPALGPDAELASGPTSTVCLLWARHFIREGWLKSMRGAPDSARSVLSAWIVAIMVAIRVRWILEGREHLATTFGPRVKVKPAIGLLVDTIG